MDKNNSSGFTGLLFAAIDHRRTKKAIRNIQQSNIANQGIVRYKPSQIEAFFDPNVPIGNMAFSGGDNSIRARSIIRAAECAYLQGFFVVVVHCGDYLLEQNMQTYFGQYLYTINKHNPLYDPFTDATNDEIIDLTLSSTTKKRPINPNGRYYINGVCDFIRSQNRMPHCYSLINCPHLDLIDQVNTAEGQGRITSSDARSIISQLLQGESERGNIETFFRDLSAQGSTTISDKTNAIHSYNCVKAADNNQIFMVDIQSSANTILINLLVNEIYLLQNRGKQVFVVADGIQLAANDVLMEFAKRTGNNAYLIATSDDVFSSFGGVEKEFNAYMGKCSLIVLSKHSSAFSCQKFSDVLGSYDMQEVTNGKTWHVDYFRQWGIGSTNTMNTSIKREYVVKPEEIQRMATNEVYILDKVTGELAFTSIV